MKIASSAAVRAAEQRLFAAGRMSSLDLMDAVIDRMYELFLPGMTEMAALRPSRVVVYAGKGNNAGDAVGLAARLGVPITLRTACAVEDLSADTRAQLARVTSSVSVDPPEPAPRTLILDGLLGSGASGALREPYRRLVCELNALRVASPASLTLSIDIPTGLNAASGEADVATVCADVTCPIGCVKPGMVADGAELYVGRMLPVALPEVEIEAATTDVVSEAQMLRGWLPRRAYDCYKNRAGRVAIVAGSMGMLGAAQLCAEAALHAGAGLVCLYCLPAVYPLLAARTAAEVMVKPVSRYAEIEEAQAQVLLVGPGLGRMQPEQVEDLRRLTEGFNGTVVLDADGLNAAASAGWTPQRSWVLTPHPGEMRRLMPDAPSGRRETVEAYTQRCDAVLLLKGARTLVAQREVTPCGDAPLFCCYNNSGGPYMANGGQGDVLAGTIAGLAAQGLSPRRAAILGASACGQAAGMAWAEGGFTPAVAASATSLYLGRALASL